MCTWENLFAKVKLWQEAGKKIVFTNGCFDILHKGHVDYLAKAADLGDVLVLGLNTDASVSKLKGSNRPIQDQNSRLQIMASLGFVDAVVLFDEPTPYNLINLIKPDVLVKGSDYEPEKIVGYDVVMSKGGAVKTIDYLEGYSTTNIEKKIKTN
ncbi:MAG: D-glycero-beta-D-manno-heptose 1-phosphate adenylyltransferase [Bacteroidetes bacterium]|nr:D-glycero-beta-D-manno-heptose 1-phosphate adenylyltransferase [Bacteroidota bacterium]